MTIATTSLTINTDFFSSKNPYPNRVTHTMSGPKHLAHAILKHLQQEAAQNPQEDKVESLEGRTLKSVGKRTHMFACGRFLGRFRMDGSCMFSDFIVCLN